MNCSNAGEEAVHAAVEKVFADCFANIVLAFSGQDCVPCQLLIVFFVIKSSFDWRSVELFWPHKDSHGIRERQGDLIRRYEIR